MVLADRTVVLADLTLVWRPLPPPPHDAQSKISQDKAASKREERLLMSSVYELGMDIIERQLKSSVRSAFGLMRVRPGS